MLQSSSREGFDAEALENAVGVCVAKVLENTLVFLRCFRAKDVIGPLFHRLHINACEERKPKQNVSTRRAKSKQPECLAKEFTIFGYSEDRTKVQHRNTAFVVLPG